jgi:hypothetical protein
MQNVQSWSFCGLGPYVIAVPYSAQSNQTGPFIWANQGSAAAGNTFLQPPGAPGGRVGAIVGQFLMLGDILQQQTEIVGTGTGSQLTFNYSLSYTPMLNAGSIYDQAGLLSGSFSEGAVMGSGLLARSTLPWTLQVWLDTFTNGAYEGSVFSVLTPNNPGQGAFSSLSTNGVTKSTASATYTYTANEQRAEWYWPPSVGAPFGFGNGVTYVGTFGGQSYTTAIIAGISSTTIGSVVLLDTGYQVNSFGALQNVGKATVNYETGALTLQLNAAAPNGDAIYAVYTQAAPYRVQWSAIGDPTNWPVPLTANAVAFQSGFQDLEVDLGPVKFIAGYPLYGVIFQEFGITRANYVGGNVVFSFAVFSRNRGIVARNAGVVVGGLVYFLAQDGFFVTDGNGVQPIGTDSANDVGIDQWVADNLNQQALEAIRCAYDSTTRCVYFSIPTGTNTMPDTLLTYNPIAARWTKSAIPAQLIWTDSNESETLGVSLFIQPQPDAFPNEWQYSTLTGPTLTGYLETCDVMDADGNLRFTTGVRPNVACTDTPQVMVGVRNSLQDAVNYSTQVPPDSFSRIAPALLEGLYTRVNISSSAASAFIGATLYQQPAGSV